MSAVSVPPKKPKSLVNLTTIASRKRLERRKEPYWMPMGERKSLGWRPLSGTWSARYFGQDDKYIYESDRFAKVPGAPDEFEAAKAIADDWFKLLTGGANREVQRGSVRAALEAYVNHLRKIGRGGAADTAHSKLKSCIYFDDEIINHQLETLTREDVLEWRERLMKGARGNNTINRYVGCAAAGLNCAVTELKFIGNPLAWTISDLPEDSGTEDGEAAVFVTPVQRDRLIKYASKWIVPYLRGTYAAAGRPGELPKATVGDYNPATNTLVLRSMKGRPAKLRARVVQLDPQDAPIFLEMVKGRHPSEPLVVNEKGTRLTSQQWDKEIRAAIAYANASSPIAEEIIPEDATAYSLRHARISELLQIVQADPITVGRQTGTSLAMMQKYYWKFIPSAMLEKFAAANGRAKKNEATADIEGITALLKKFAAANGQAAASGIEAVAALLKQIADTSPKVV